MEGGANLLDNHSVNPGGKKQGSGGGAVSGSGSGRAHHQVTQGTPQNMPNCWICKWLDGDGRKILGKAGNQRFDCDNLFANHSNKYYHGCPKFIEMNVGQRRTTCYKSSPCMGLIYKPEHNNSCKIKVDFKKSNVKSKYTCKKDNCLMNCWVCMIHKTDNKAFLNEVKIQIKTRELNMGVHVRLNVGGVREETGRGSLSSSGSLQLMPGASWTPQIVAHSDCNHPEVQNQVEELFRTVEDQGVENVAEPKGRPIFMFFSVVGTNKPHILQLRV